MIQKLDEKYYKNLHDVSKLDELMSKVDPHTIDLWLTKNVVLKRAHDDSSPIVYLKSTFGERKSVDTTGKYQTFLELLPSWKNIPRRRKSIICTEVDDVVEQYVKDGKQIYYVFPIKNYNVAVSSDFDFLDVELSVGGKFLHMWELDLLLKNLSKFANGDFIDGIELLIKTQDINNVILIREVMDVEAAMNFYIFISRCSSFDDFISKVSPIWAPENVGIKNIKMSDVNNSSFNGECWFEGGCLLVEKYLAIKWKRRRLKDKTIDEGIHDKYIKKAIFMIGSPGSGKSTIASEISNRTGMKIVDPDKVHELYIKQKRNINHEKIYNITSNQKDIFLKGNLGLILDRTGKNFDVIKKSKEELEELGYETFCVIVYVVPSIAKERIAKRFVKTGRNVDLDYFDDAIKTISSNIKSYKNLFGKNYVFFVNDGTYNKETHLFKHVNKFLNSSMKNEHLINESTPLFDGVIYVDMDGVLTDFDTHYINTKESGGMMFKEYEKLHGYDAAWKVVDDNGAEWWEHMPWSVDGKQLWQHLIKNYKNVQILSSTSDRDNARQGKLLWIQRELGNDVVVNLVDHAVDKPTFQKSSNDVLIDDLTVNIEQWNVSGGIGILYKNFLDTKNHLDMIIT